ncbi:L,D-transpeptidase family protein [Leptotrichia sp. oral taxon 847]|uniref:L,D-transpeptidase family protein n=1 Tax=Leptotrichia sp. oral taxon 847 TaxID=1785996 RepID=UPI0007681513|nr:L,D-transpeptidase family protein [Leptotrichia sp. oral taxon 847]AMD94692.1 hypothetical protein AXF11_03195 [Leptotrichia sp. oral taxon 847]
MKTKKIKFFILALTLISMISVNNFSAPKNSQKIEWKKVTLEPDLNEDGVKDKIEVEYMQSGDSVKMRFTPFVTNEKGKYTKGEKIEKTIKKGDFEKEFDNFIKSYIAEYPKKQNTKKKQQNENKNSNNLNNIKNAQDSVITPENHKNESDKKTQIKNSNSIKGPYSYSTYYLKERPKNLTFNYEYDKNSPKDMDEFVFIKNKSNIRKEPNTNAKVIKEAKYGNKFKVIGLVKSNSEGKSDDWYEVFLDGQLGYIPKSSAEKREFDWQDMMQKVNKTNAFIRDALAKSKKIYVLDDYVPLGGSGGGNRDKFGNRANQSEPAYANSSFKNANAINIPDRTIMTIEEDNDKYTKVKIDAFDEGTYYIKPSTRNMLKDSGITKEIERFIYVDRSSQNEMVIEKSGNNWNVVTSSFVTTGKDSGNSFATPYGTFLIAYAKPVMQYTGSDNKDVVGDAKNAVRFSGGGYMHSIPSLFEPKNTREQRKKVTAEKIGTYPESHKCIRHYDDQIKFIYDWLGNSTPGDKNGLRVPSTPTVMLVK